MYAAGTVLKINMGAFFHYGVADGLGQVIHNSKKRMQVTQESYEAFSGGREIVVSEITSANPAMAAVIARRYIGMPYRLFKKNCEHFARLCHGLVEESTQLQKYILSALTAGIAASSKNTTIQVISGGATLGALLTPTEQSPYKNATIGALIAAGILILAA